MPQFHPLLLLLLLLSSAASAEPPPSERDALLSFLSSTPHSRRLRWSSSSSACRWTGVTCDSADASVIELRLPAIGLSGNLSSSAFSALSSLQVLSLRRNRLAGAIPDLSNLTSLRALNLQGNLFSGSIPPAISRLNNLSRIDLSNNGLSGEIPFSLSSLTQLKLLYLENNRLSGKLPSLDLPALKFLNVSHNRLNGSIPRTLARFLASAFAGNLDLCGDPLPACNPFFPPAPSPFPAIEPSGSSRKLSTAAIIAIAVAGGLLLLILLLLVIFLVNRRRRRRGAPPPPKQAMATERSLGMGAAETVATSSTSKEEMGGRDGEKNKLVFFGNGGSYSFDLEDLLRASAEVLGKGITGTSYKAVLEDATTVVVKRLKDVGAQRMEFEAQMEVLGRLRSHENVVPLRAYYFSKDEKLLVYDYIAAGSLSALLHGGRGSGRPPLDWDNRLRIVLAAGHGLLHLHHSAALPHGNLKASNILLRPDPDAAALSDYGLNAIFNALPAHGNHAVGYRAPEFVETRRPTFKSDVYSFGVLLLELLTGKSPTQDSFGGDGIDLPRWVQSVVREEWTAEVFDVDLMRVEGNLEEEMVQLLQIAMSCVALLPDSRPELGNVVKMIEEIARRGDDGEDGRLNSSDDPTKGTSAGPTP